MKKLFRLMSIFMLLAMMITVVPAGSYTGSVMADGVSGVPVQVLDDPPQGFISPRLQQALRVLEQSGFEGPTIVGTARDTRTTIAFQSDLPQFDIGDSLAAYSPLDNVIIVSDEFANADVRTLAALLAHEGTHLIDDRLYNKDGLRAREATRGFDPYTCFAREMDSFGTEVRFWARVFPPTASNPEGGKPGDPSQLNRAENDANALLRIRDSFEAAQLVQAIMAAYLLPGQSCSAERPS